MRCEQVTSTSSVEGPAVGAPAGARPPAPCCRTTLGHGQSSEPQTGTIASALGAPRLRPPQGIDALACTGRGWVYGQWTQHGAPLGDVILARGQPRGICHKRLQCSGRFMILLLSTVPCHAMPCHMTDALGVAASLLSNFTGRRHGASMPCAAVLANVDATTEV